MILIIDNYDSFTYNLVQYFGQLGCDIVTKRNDELTVEQVCAMKPQRICISPGPGRPEDAGISTDIVRELGRTIPVLGVCLGHQCIAAAFGAEIVRAERLMHGKTSPISHNSTGLFADLPNPFAATRYHSLLVRRETLPPSLQITAETAEGEVMGLRHHEFPIHGVQFHPESILTGSGLKLIENFLKV
jgi:para-aminobenzoate synthetase component 2